MTDKRPTSIGDAPSPDDLRSSEPDRVGRVDFSTRLTSAGDDQAEPPPHLRRPSPRGTARPRASSVALTGDPTGPTTGPTTRATPVRRADGTTASATPRATPLILPPAKVDTELAQEAARIRRELAGARGEIVADDSFPQAPADRARRTPPQTGTSEATPIAATRGAAPAAPPSAPPSAPAAPQAAPTAPTPAPAPAPVNRPRFRRVRTAASLRSTEVDAPATPAATPDSSPTAREETAEAPTPDPGASTTRDDAIVDEMRAAATQAEELAVALRQHAGAAAAFEAATRAPAPEASSDLDHDLDDDLDDDFDGARYEDGYEDDPADLEGVRFSEVTEELDVDVETSVTDTAASIIATMRAIGDAHQRHLEAIELEAARRCELQTAQAELDAELIRLHARREAHAIISAARMRAGEDTTPVESDRLSEIGETFSRFAESIETTIASGPASPDTPRTS